MFKYSGLLNLVCGFVLAYLFSIELHEYSWWQGIFHGAWIPYNWIISWFANDWWVEAPNHTTAYAVFFWLGGFSSVPAFFTFLVLAIKAFKK